MTLMLFGIEIKSSLLYLDVLTNKGVNNLGICNCITVEWLINLLLLIFDVNCLWGRGGGGVGTHNILRRPRDRESIVVKKV